MRLLFSDVFFVANTSAVPARIEVAGAIADPRTGEIREHAGEVELAPYQAILVLRGLTFSVKSHEVTCDLVNKVRSRGWQVQFPGEDAADVSFPHRWEDLRTGYSGSASYRAQFTLESAGDVVLALGAADALPSELADRGIRGPSFRAKVRYPIGVAASVLVDGREAGSIWSAPFELALGTLDAGEHELEIVVHNLTANRLAADEHLPRAAAEVERVHGRRFRIQDLDLALEGVESGLLAEPVLKVRG